MLIGVIVAIFIGFSGGVIVSHDDTCQKGQTYTTNTGAGQFRCTDADRK